MTDGLPLQVGCITADPPALYGASRSLLLLLDRLAPAGVHMDIATFVPGALGPELAARGYAPATIFAAGERDWYRRANRLGKLARLAVECAQASRRVARFLRTCSARVAYINTIEFGTPVLGARLAGLPGVVHMRESLDHLHGRDLMARLRRATVCRLPSAFICNSRASAALLADLGARADRIAVVPNAVDTERFSATAFARATARRQLALPAEAPLVVAIARLSAEKGIPDLLDAMPLVRERHPAAQLAVVGGPLQGTFHAAHLAPRLARPGSSDFIRMAGYCDDPRPWIAAADLVVVPSREESFGRVNIEAMAMERAVVATRVGGIPEVVDDGVTGLLVPPADPAALAAAIAQLLADPVRREAFGAAGRARVNRQFSPQAYADAIGSILRQAAERGMS